MAKEAQLEDRSGEGDVDSKIQVEVWRKMEAAGQMRACLQFFFHLHSKQFRLGWRSGKTDLAVNESCKWQVVKEIGEILPDVGVSVLAQALIVEAVHLRYLAALVIPAQNRDAVFEPNLTHKHKSID